MKIERGTQPTPFVAHSIKTASQKTACPEMTLDHCKRTLGRVTSARVLLFCLVRTHLLRVGDPLRLVLFVADLTRLPFPAEASLRQRAVSTIRRIRFVAILDSLAAIFDLAGLVRVRHRLARWTPVAVRLSIVNEGHFVELRTLRTVLFLCRGRWQTVQVTLGNRLTEVLAVGRVIFAADAFDR